MTRLPTLLATVVATVCSAGVLAPAVAHADSYVSRDVAHDVRITDPSGVQNAATSRRNGDVLSSGVVHGRRVVRVAMRYAEMSRRDPVVLHVFRLRTDEGLVREVTVQASRGSWGGRARVTTGRGRVVRCAVRAELDPSERLARVTVPRRCLSNPRWVRVGMGVLIPVGEDSVYADDARTDGRLYDNPTYGPVVRR